MRNILLLLTLAGALGAQETSSWMPAATVAVRPAPVNPNLLPRPAGQSLWRTSIAALTVANVMDVHSSWGKHELNSTLAGPAGQFGKQGALIKAALQGSLIGVEYALTRHHPSPRFYRALSILNFSAAATITTVAAHNYTIPR